MVIRPNVNTLNEVFPVFKNKFCLQLNYLRFKNRVNFKFLIMEVLTDR